MTVTTLRYTFFDTETTGLPIFGDFTKVRLIQISWQQYDETGSLILSKSHYIKPEGFLVPQEATNINNITNEILIEKGLDFIQVINEFFTDVDKSSYLIAHNIEYDVSVLSNECKIHKILHKFGGKYFCTYKNFPRTPTEKSAKLIDRYYDCFHEYPLTAHDASADTKSCARIFFWKKMGKRIF